MGNSTSLLHPYDSTEAAGDCDPLANATLKLGIIIELVTVPCAPKESPTKKHGEEGVKKCTHVIIDKVKGVSKIPLDNEGHEIPAALDDAGGCPLAPIVAGPSLTVASGADTDVSTNGVVVVSKDPDKLESKNNTVH